MNCVNEKDCRFCVQKPALGTYCICMCVCVAAGGCVMRLSVEGWLLELRGGGSIISGTIVFRLYIFCSTIVEIKYTIIKHEINHINYSPRKAVYFC